MRQKFVTPSLLNIEEGKRGAVAKELINNGIKWIHYDVMDGEFVPNTAIEFAEIRDIKNQEPKHMMDIHLMVKNFYDYLPSFKEVGDILTIHYEAIENVNEFLEFCKNNLDEYKMGVAIKPNTPVEVLDPLLPYLSLVLIMSVEPGKGGQKFIDSSLDKIKYFYNQRNKNNYSYLIQVDGGINDTTGPLALAAGADAVVAGTYLVFEPTKEKIQSILGKKYKL